jgi:hypothetical protein
MLWAIVLGSATLGITKSAIRVFGRLLPWGPSSTGKYWTVLLFLAVVFGTHWFVGACDSVPRPFGRLSYYRGVGLETWAAGFVGHMMLASTVYHLLLAAALWGVHEASHPRSIVQNGAWPIKILALPLLALASMWLVPLRHLHHFFLSSLAAASVFLLVQAVLLLDFVYDEGECLQSRLEHEPDDRLVRFGSGLFAGVALAFSHGWLALHAFAIDGRNGAAVGLCIAQMLLQCLLLAAGLGIHRRAGLFAPLSSVYLASLVCLCTTLVLAEALGLLRGRRPVDTGINGALLALSLAHAAYSVGLQSCRIRGPGVGCCGRDAAGDAGTAPRDADVHYNMSLFNVVFALASCHAYLVCTQWSDFQTGGGTVRAVAHPHLALCGKLFSSFALSLLYLWSMVAPLVWREREFPHG